MTDPKYAALTESLLKKYKNKAGVVRAVKPIISRAAVYDFFKDVSEKKEASEEVAEILTMFDKGSPRVLYGLMNAFLENSRVNAVTTEIKERFEGTYSYYRYFHELNETNMDYVSGTIKIAVDGGVPTFQHSSHHHKGSVEIDNEGIVLFAEGRLYLLGWRHGVLRLSIVVPSKNEKTIPLYGIVLSARHQRNDPFAARFLLVRDSQVELNEKLGDTTPYEKSEETREVDQYVKTRGEFAFRDLCSDDLYFMLGFFR